MTDKNTIEGLDEKDRRIAPCPYFGKCGGCSWQDIKYSAQLRHKESRVKELFGGCSPIIPAPDEYHYRNRMDLAFGPDYTLGLKSGKARVIDLDHCLLMSETSNALLPRLKKFVSDQEMNSYPTGIIRHVVIRDGRNIKNTVLNVLTSSDGIFPLEELWEELKDAVQGITWSINPSPADRSVGDIQKTCGQDHLVESLGGLKFNIPVQSFFQTNTLQAERLLKVISDFADLQGGENLLDLFSGTGSIGLSLAHKAKKVVGIEENQPAAELSLTNAELNGIKNYSVFSARVENCLDVWRLKFEVVLVDPPRPGVHKTALKAIGELKPAKVIYVSCNPTTQKHDVEILKGFGYEIVDCQPLDLFPHTPHIENVIALKRSR